MINNQSNVSFLFKGLKIIDSKKLKGFWEIGVIFFDFRLNSESEDDFEEEMFDAEILDISNEERRYVFCMVNINVEKNIIAKSYSDVARMERSEFWVNEVERISVTQNSEVDKFLWSSIVNRTVSNQVLKNLFYLNERCVEINFEDIR